MNPSIRYISEALPPMKSALEAQQPEWLPEFEDFVKCLGPRPLVYERAQREWDAAVVGALLAWGFFVSQMGDDSAETPVADTPADEPAPSDVDNVPADNVPADEAPRVSSLVGVGGTYAILGPSGAPLVEGLR